MINYKHIIIILLVLLSTACAMSGSTGTNAIDTETPASADPISDTESDLYESDDSAMSIPVTIAKMESVNVEKTTVTQETSSGLQTKTGFAIKTATAPNTYRIVGTADAVNTEQANALLLVNGDLITSHEVADDGSFDATISAVEGDPVMMIPINDADQGAPPVFAQKENSVTTYSFTNSDKINILQTPIMDRGYYYFSQQNDDDTFDLFRRHIDGSYVQVIAEDLVSAPRVVAVSENHDVVMATQNGRVHYLKHSDDVADLDIYEGMAGFLVAWDDPTMIMDVGEPLNLSEGSITPVSVQLFFSDAENGVFLATKKYISADSTEPQEYLLRFYDLDTNEETGLIESINYSNPLFSQGAGEILYVFVPPANAGKAALFSIMMSNGTTAWNNRQLIYEHEVGPTIMHMASSGKQMIMFVDLLDNTHRFYQLDAITGEALLFAQEDLDLERIMTPYLVVSVESEVEDSEFITCSINTSETGLDWLVYSRVRSGEMDDLYVIDSGTYGQSCSGRYTIDDDGHMVFYRAYNQDDGSEGMPQVSLFDVYSLDPELLPLAD